MIRFLAAREAGLDSPSFLTRAETTRRVFSLDLSKYKDVERIHTGSVNSLDLDPIENRYLLSGASNGVIAIHDVENFSSNIKYTYKYQCGIGRSHRHVHKNSIETVQWYSLDTGLFLSSGTDRLLKVWDTNRLIPADTFSFDGIVYNHHMSPVATKHSLVAVGCQTSYVRLVDLRVGSSTHMLSGHKGSVLTVKWSPREEFLLASGSADNRVQLWDIRRAKGSLMSLDQHNGETITASTKTNTAHHGRVNGMCFTQDGLFLMTFGTDDCLHLWNTNTGKNTLVNYGFMDNNSKKCVQFCLSQGGQPDVAFVPNYSNIDVLDLHQGTKISLLRGHYNPVNCCVFHPYRQELFSGGSDRNILVWVPDTDSAYEDHLNAEKSENSKKTGSFVSRTAATADAWSDDEDD